MKANYLERRYEKIRLRAYELWQEAGEPEGREAEFWRRAEAEIPQDAASDGEASDDG